MGIDYYMVCEERQDLFLLNRGDWSPVTDLLQFGRPEKEMFALAVEHVWIERYDDETLNECALSVGRTLWDWCEERGWKVRLTNDCATDAERWHAWPVTGDADNPEPEVYAQMTVSQQRERDALLGDSRALLGVISDLRRYREITRKHLDVWFGWVDAGVVPSAALEMFKQEVEAIEAGEGRKE